ncbi:hypothetical protein GCM10027030_11420 [Luteococcus sediminum]
MDSNQAVIVEDVAAWRQVILGDGARRRQRVTLHGEFRGKLKHASGRTSLILPGIAGDDSSGFASLGGYVVSVNKVDVAAGDQIHCAAEMAGTLRVDNRGQLYLNNATLALKPNLRGPYERWRARQCRLSGIRVGERPRVKLSQTETEVTAHLTANADKRILWAGSRELKAFGDAVRTEHGVDRKIADRLLAQDVSLGSHDTPQKLAALLNTVSSDNTAMVIIARGGGDIGDLARLENADLLRAAKECAQRVPIILAAGHKDDELLLGGAVTWSVGVPANLGYVLRPFCHGLGGTTADRKSKEFQRRQANSLRRQLLDLSSENNALSRELADKTSELRRALRDLGDARRQTQHAYDEAGRQLRWTTQRHLDGLAEQARHRIARTYHLACFTMALLTATAWLAIDSFAPEFVRGHPQAVLGTSLITLIICLHLALAPRRLGKRPRFASSKPIDQEAAFRSVRTVCGYNRAVHATDISMDTHSQ